MLRTVVRATLGVISVPVQAGSLRNARDALHAIGARTCATAAAKEHRASTPGYPSNLRGSAALTGDRRSVITVHLPNSDSLADHNGA